MSFFATFFLYFLPLITLPIIIHLLSKSRIKTVEFSSLKFLAKLKKDAIRKLKLRQIILLILRTLLILLIILFFARPYIMTSNEDIYPEKGETLILQVDNSHSTAEKYQDKTLLQNKLMEISRQAEFFDYPITLAIQNITDPNNITDYGMIENPAAFEKALTTIPSGHQAAQLTRSFQTIESYISKNKLLHTNLWTLSDFQTRENYETDLKISLARLTENNNTTITLFPIRHHGNNNAISKVLFPDQIIEINKNLLIKTHIQYWQEFQENKVSLFIDNQRVAQDITKSPSETVDFEFAPLKTGTITGYLTLPPDDLIADNKYYFALDIPEKVRILLVSKKIQHTYLTRALNAGKESLFQVRNISPGILAMENLDDYDVLLFHNVAELNDIYKDKLNNFLKRGKGIIVIPGIDNEIDSYNRFWHEQMGLPQWTRNLGGGTDSYLKLQNINTNHPVFAQVWAEKERFQSASRFYTVPAFQANENHNVLIDYNTSHPFMMELNNRKIMLLGSFITAQESTLQLSGFFPVLLQQTVLYLSNFSHSLINQTVGDTLRHRVFQPENITDYSLRTPMNKRYLPDMDDKNSELTFTNTEVPGFYRLYEKDEAVREFAVNLDSRETKGTFLSEKELKELVSEHSKNVAIYAGEQSTDQLHSNKELNSIILILIILILISETIIARINRNN